MTFAERYGAAQVPALTHRSCDALFQGLRIALNRELEQLETLLQELPELCTTRSGRGDLFHSLEDRLVNMRSEATPA